MSLLDLWRELGRDYVDVEHDGRLKDALIGSAVLLFTLVAMIVVAAITCAAVPA